MRENPNSFLNLQYSSNFLSVVFYDTLRFLFDLQIQFENLLIKSYLGNNYIINLIKFCGFILDYYFFLFKIYDEKSEINLNIHQNFQENLNEALNCTIILNKKTIFLLKFDLKLGDSLNSRDNIIFKEIIKIYENLNAILTNSDLKLFLSNSFYKKIIETLKKKEEFMNVNEKIISSVIHQRILFNLKFVIIFENSYDLDKKGNFANIFEELFVEYPQTFKKFKTKIMEEFVYDLPEFRFEKEYTSNFTNDLNDEVKHINIFL